MRRAGKSYRRALEAFTAGGDVNPNTVEVLISRLRKRLDDIGADRSIYAPRHRLSAQGTALNALLSADFRPARDHTVLMSIFAYGWIYWQAQSIEIAVRRVLLNQAK